MDVSLYDCQYYRAVGEGYEWCSLSEHPCMNMSGDLDDCEDWKMLKEQEEDA